MSNWPYVVPPAAIGAFWAALGAWWVTGDLIWIIPMTTVWALLGIFAGWSVLREYNLSFLATFADLAAAKRRQAPQWALTRDACEVANLCDGCFYR